MQGVSPMNFIDFDDGARRQLESRTPAVFLLPNLRTIIAWTNVLPFTSLFLTPRVHHLKLMMDPGEIPSLSSLVLEIPLRSPKLRSLHLENDGFWNPSDRFQFIHTLIELFKDFKLEEFVCNWLPLSQDMLNVVLGMPELSSVHIYAAMQDLAQVLHTHPVQEPRIRNFHLCAPQLIPSSLPHIISSLFPSKLEALSITSRNGWSCDAMELTGLISTLVNTCSPKYLTIIYISTGYYDSPQAGAIIDFKMLEPLLRFTHLRCISLPEHPFDLTDAEIKDMALAWPNLEGLSYWQYQYVSPEGLNTIVPRTSLRGLLWLATHCRKLHSLTFPFYSSSGAVEGLTEDEMASAEGHNLSFFDVGFSEIECAEEVAKFINRVFPNLTLLAFGRPNTEQWEKVQKLIQVL
jgi:hypothetical protein